LVKHEYLGTRALAYKIQNNFRAHYVILSIDGTFAAIKEYERKIKLSENVIRFLNSKVKSFMDNPLLNSKISGEPEVNVTEKN
jgi:small subunit ribosomal protein S6